MVNLVVVVSSLFLVCFASSEMRVSSKQAFNASKSNYVLVLKVNSGKRLGLKVNSVSQSVSQSLIQSISQSVSQSAVSQSFIGSFINSFIRPLDSLARSVRHLFRNSCIQLRNFRSGSRFVFEPRFRCYFNQN